MIDISRYETMIKTCVIEYASNYNLLHITQKRETREALRGISIITLLFCISLSIMF